MPTDNAAWYPDNGVTNHVTNDAQTLIDPTLYQGPDQLQIGNGTCLTILNWFLYFNFKVISIETCQYSTCP